MDVLKKDLIDFKQLFIVNFLQQLENDNLLITELMDLILKDFQDFELSTTDGDKANIGFLNDCVYRLSWPGYFEGPTLDLVKHYVEIIIMKIR